MSAVPGRALLVLGMHRSGTSAVTGVLDILGVKVGGELLRAVAGVNPKGFWEHAGVVALHDRVFMALESAWHDGRNLPERWWERPQLQSLQRELRTILHTDFGTAEVWAVKDPRLCRLLPLWRPLLEAEGIPAHALLVLRHPLEVAQSLGERDGICGDLSHLLWLQHITAAVRETHGWPRGVLAFEDLLRGWEPAIDVAFAALPLRLPARTDEMRRRVTAFLEPSLRHHEGAVGTGSLLERLAVRCYDACRAVRDSAQLEATLEPIAAEVRAIAGQAAPWLQQIQAVLSAREAVTARLRHEQAERQIEVAALQTEIARIKGTVSWRVTGPLRAIWNLLRPPGRR